MGRKKRRTRRYQNGSLCESPDGKRWIVKFYYAPGKQTTKTLGPKSQISRRQAEMMREEPALAQLIEELGVQVGGHPPSPGGNAETLSTEEAT